MRPPVAYLPGDLEAGLAQALDAVLRKECGPGEGAVLRMGLGSREGLAFGRYQPMPREAWGLSWVQRRITGGRLVPAGPGVLEVSVIAPSLTDLKLRGDPITSELLLNRFVRGVLRGLGRLGLDAVYPGRDLITLGRRALGHAAFDIDEEGRPLVQFQLAWTTSLAEVAPRLREAGGLAEGRRDLLSPEACTTLAEALGGPPGIERVFEAIREGFAEHVGASVPVAPLPEALKAEAASRSADTFERREWRSDRTPPASLDRTARVPSQLGSFEVALSLEKGGRLGQVRLLGEFIADWPAVEALEGALPGCPTEWRSIARVVDRVLGTPPHVVLGLGPRKTIPDTIVRALG